MGLVIAVGGGKGGIGKSVLACNAAVAFAQAGYATTLVDCDLGAANVHTMFGISKPPVLLEDFLSRKVASLADARIPSPQRGLSLVCGGMPVLGTANIPFQTKMRLVRHLRSLDSQVVVCDIGAGTSYNVLDLYNAADVRAVVFVPQLTSVHNGYGFLKAAVHRHLLRSLDTEARDFLTSAGPGAGEESVADMLTRLAGYSARSAEQAKGVLARYTAVIVGNQVDGPKDAQVIKAVAQMVRDHLHLRAEVAAMLRTGDKIRCSINARRPFMMDAGLSSNAEALRSLVHALVRLGNEAVRVTSEQETLVEEAVRRTIESYQRRYPRYPVDVDAAFETEGRVFEGRTKDMGLGGVALVFDKEVPPNASGMLFLGPLDNGEVLTCPVVWRHSRKEDGLVGFSFAVQDPVVREKIERIVARLSQAHDAVG